MIKKRKTSIDADVRNFVKDAVVFPLLMGTLSNTAQSQLKGRCGQWKK